MCMLILLLAACGQQKNNTQQFDSSQPLQINGQSYLPLRAQLIDTNVTLEWKEDQLYLTEKGFEAVLQPGMPYLYRRGFIVAVLPDAFLEQDGEGYLSKAVWDVIFSDGTLLNDILFFKDEIADALKDSDSETSMVVLSEVELPRSMSIDIPNLNTKRIFEEKQLNEYPAIFTEELENMGVENAGTYTYSEYALMTKARSVKEAGLSQSFLRNKALAQEDPAKWTVRAFKDWQTQMQLEEVYAALTDEQRGFLEEKNILLEDLHWLEKEFYDSYIQRTDEELPEVIKGYYRMRLNVMDSPKVKKLKS